MNEFTLNVTVPQPYEQALARVRELLTETGFGVLTEIDMASTLKAKLDVDIEPRIILGACSPPLAHRALLADPRIATMLPCNVVVAAVPGGSTVEIFDPAVMAEFNPALAEVAGEARVRLLGMMDALAAETSAAKEDDDATRA